ncbi:MAG: acetate kinase [Kangiellaceae bacterium]|nr:acetate kinase [Kangiellaceae bacterium]|tara:strand:+ start:28421 stop:29614 length:1194 start_codon:yes stop_codon:yes gene_type:complete
MTQQYVLVLNCGSSSIKFAIIQAATGEQPFSGIAERLHSAEALLKFEIYGEKIRLDIPNASHLDAVQRIVASLDDHPTLKSQLIAVGHRVVHGGEAFSQSTVIDDKTLEGIKGCSRLAPLHNPANVIGIEAAMSAFPSLPQVAVFDTAFHQSMPAQAYLYPIPYNLYEEQGVRRYGFHGTSHRFVTAEAARLLNKPLNSLALLSAHLGNGCSATAVLNGQSIDTTMGLTPLEGLVMGTRSGDVDPSLHGYLVDQLGWDIHEVVDMLNKQSGLKGLSGISNDMRTLGEEAEKGNKRCALAIDVFCYRLAKHLGALAVSLGRIDALIFTGGIGENAAMIRSKVLKQLGVFGFDVDETMNMQHGRDNNGCITTNLGPTAMVVATNEEWLIASDAAQLVHA